MFPKDDIYTIPLPGSNLVFTRYLYLKDEVKLSLLISVLNKHTDAIFWAYELFYSGFQLEMFQLIWTIYYDFFATLNPSFEVYLLKKQIEILSTNANANTLISAIIQDLCIREYNTDIFKLRQITKMFEVTPDYSNDIYPKTLKEVTNQIKIWGEKKDYASIGYYILSHNTQFDLFEILLSLDVHSRVLKGFSKTIQNATDMSISHKIIGLVKILTHLMDIDKDKSYVESKKYIRVKPHDIIMYDTINDTDTDTINDTDTDTNILTYKVLQTACICGIDDLKYLSLFHLERYTTKKLQEIYNEHWLYHASFSPIWKQRIQLYRGYVDYTNQTVQFINDEWLESFYDNFGYEPDEQPLWVKNRVLMDIENVNDWTHFETKHGTHNKVIIDRDILSELSIEKIVYL